MSPSGYVELKAPQALAGLVARVLRQSGVTGVLTVSLVQARGAYRVGDELNVPPYDVEAIGDVWHRPE